MDIAVKRGFAIGFVVLAGLAAGYGCQPELKRAMQALRGGEKPATLAGPSGPTTKPSEPGASEAKPSDAPPSGPAPAPQAEAPAPSSPPAAAPTPAAPAPSDSTTPQAPAGSATAPSTPGSSAAVTSPAGDVPADAAQDPAKGGAFDIVRVEPSGEMVIAGRCAADCSAELTANGKTHDTAKADAQGQFAMTPAPLPPGDYQLGLRTRTPDGKQETSSQTLTVAIPTPPSKDVVVVLNAPDAPSKILQQPEPKVAAAPGAREDKQVVAPGSELGAGAGPTQDQKPAVPATATPLAIGAIEAENGRVFAQGTGPTGAPLRLYLNNAPLAAATIGADSRWSLRVEQGLAPGAYIVRADQLDPQDARVIARVEASFSYAPQVAAAAPASPPTPADRQVAAPPSAAVTAPAATAVPQETVPQPSTAPAAQDPVPQPAAPSESPASAVKPADPSASASNGVTAPPSAPPSANPVVASIDTAQVRRGDSLWRISRTTYGRGIRYTEIYQANDGQIRNPNLIYPGQVLVLPGADAQAPTRPARP